MERCWKIITTQWLAIKSSKHINDIPHGLDEVAMNSIKPDKNEELFKSYSRIVEVKEQWKLWDMLNLALGGRRRPIPFELIESHS